MQYPTLKRVLHSFHSDEGQNLQHALKEYTLFRDVRHRQLAGLVPAFRVKGFQDEEIVCHCPDATHDAFVLLKGVVAVTRKKDDAVHVLQLERSGAVFNIGPLVGRDREEAGVRALGNVEVLAIDNALLLRKLERDTRLGYGITRSLCRLALEQCERLMERYCN
ncbi:MAG: Crp/Fnr family transcriptional regulator [Chloroflexi bacterium]|nr:Crp/Fnr family transcriptional regulator [Chloroflexota bacterium]